MIRPDLGIIFLRFAEARFARPARQAGKSLRFYRRGSRVDEPAASSRRRHPSPRANARFDYLLDLPEATDIGAKVNDAMRDVEKCNQQLAGVLPKTYNLSTSTLLKELLKKISEIPPPSTTKRWANLPITSSANSPVDSNH